MKSAVLENMLPFTGSVTIRESLHVRRCVGSRRIRIAFVSLYTFSLSLAKRTKRIHIYITSSDFFFIIK